MNKTARITGMSIFILVLLAIITLMLSFSIRQPAHAANSRINMLLLTPADMPIDCILSTFRIGENVSRIVLEFYKGSDKLEMMFDGKMRKNGNNITAESTIIIAYAIAKSPEEAIVAAQRQARSNAEIIPEIAPKKNIADLVDRAWGRGGRYIYVKENIICDIFIYRREGIDDQLTTLIELTANRIAKYREGKPTPVTFIPLSSDEVHQPIQATWDEQDIGNTLWGKQSLILGIVKEGVPREIPAKQIGRTRDYQVPLKYIAAILDPKARVKIKGKTAEVTLLEKAISLSDGDATVTCGGKAMKIAVPVVITRGQVIVPLSMFAVTVGKRITWTRQDGRTIGEF